MVCFCISLDAAESKYSLDSIAKSLETWAKPTHYQVRPQVPKKIPAPSAPIVQKSLEIWPDKYSLVGIAKSLETWARPANPQNKTEKVKKILAPPAPVQSLPDWSIIVFENNPDAIKSSDSQRGFTSVSDTAVPENLEVLIEQPTNQDFVRERVWKTRDMHDEKSVRSTSNDVAATATSFATWIKSTAKGKHKIIVLQGREGYDKAFLRSFASAFKDVGIRADVIILTGSIDNTIETIDELKDSTPYLIVSELEVPAGGFPAARVFTMLRTPTIQPLEFVKLFPRSYVEEYSHDGSATNPENAYSTVGMASIDTAKWILAANSFKSENKDEHIRTLSVEMPRRAGYPREVIESAAVITIDPAHARSFELHIEASPVLDSAKALSVIKSAWQRSNAGLVLPESFAYSIQDSGNGSDLRREFIVKGDVVSPVTFRPWLPGAQYVILTITDKNGRTTVRQYTRERDYVSVETFPQSSFMISEAHSQGLPRIEGASLIKWERLSQAVGDPAR